jgi:hypothetical protein
MELQKTEFSDIISPMDKQVLPSEEPIPMKSPFIYCCYGGKGRGKSTVIYNLLDKKFRGKFDTIWLCSQTYANDMHSKPVLSDLVEELQQSGQVFDDIDEEIAAHILNKLQEYNDKARGGKKKPHHLLILDDCLSSLKNAKKSLTNKFWVNHRHYNLSVCVTSQKYTSLPLLLRQNTNVMSLFGSKSKKDLLAVIDDLDVDPAFFKEIYHFATSEPNSFLHLNLMTPEIIYYKNFDKIKIL